MDVTVFWYAGSDWINGICKRGIVDCIWTEDHPRTAQQSDGETWQVIC